MKNEKLPQFQPHFLAPKYWGFWLGVAIWRSLLLLPYPILRHIGNGLGWLFSKLKVGKRRAAIAVSSERSEKSTGGEILTV